MKLLIFALTVCASSAFARSDMMTNEPADWRRVRVDRVTCQAGADSSGNVIHTTTGREYVADFDTCTRLLGEAGPAININGFVEIKILVNGLDGRVVGYL